MWPWTVATAQPGAPVRALLFPDEGKRLSTLITLIDVEPHQFRTIFRVVTERMAEFPYHVYLTDHPDLSVFYRDGRIVEYIPSTRQQKRHPDREWRLFLRQRRSLLLAKWAPATVLSYGTPLEEFIARAPGPGTTAPPPEQPD
jgi:hypothetical protein